MSLVSLTFGRGLLYVNFKLSFNFFNAYYVLLNKIVSRNFPSSHFVCFTSFFIRKVGDEFRYKIRFDGVKFPEDGPVMKKKTVKWELSTEIMHMKGEVLMGEVNMALLLNDDSHYRCDFKTTYK